MNSISYATNNNTPPDELELTSSFSNLDYQKENVNLACLKDFSDLVLNEKILHPFDALKHLDYLYLNFIANSDQKLAEVLIFDQDKKQDAFNYLLELARNYLHKNGVNENPELIYNNWIFLISLSLPLISKAIPFKRDILDAQLRSFLENSLR